MNNIKCLGKVVLIILSVVWVGCSFSGCSHNTPLLFAMLILLCINTVLLAACFTILLINILKK